MLLLRYLNIESLVHLLVEYVGLLPTDELQVVRGQLGLLLRNQHLGNLLVRGSHVRTHVILLLEFIHRGLVKVSRKRTSID